MLRARVADIRASLQRGAAWSLTPGYHAPVDHEHIIDLAVTLIEGAELYLALSKIDSRPIPRVVRVLHIRELLEAVFPRIWEELELKDRLGDEDAEVVRGLLFEALYRVARARGYERRYRVSWTRFGAEQTGLSPAESSQKSVGYALVFDPDRETAVYISGSSAESFGQTWEWRDDQWQSRRVIEHAIEPPHNQGFRGFHDPGRQGIACWTLVAAEPMEYERYRPLGLLVRPDGVEMIEAGDPALQPVVPSEMLFVFGAIFGRDPGSGDTVMLARDSVHVLRDRAWTRVCELPAGATSREWWPGSRASFVHDGQLYFTWTDRDGFSTRCRLLRFTGRGVEERKPPSPPRNGAGTLLSEGTGVRFVRDGVQWRLVGSGDAMQWQEVESAATLPDYRLAWGAVLPGGEILIGPGDYPDSGGSRRHQRIFLRVRGDQVDQLGEVLEGVGACPSDRVLLGHGDRIFAVHTDGRVERVRGAERERLADSGPGAALVLAGICVATDARVSGQASGRLSGRFSGQMTDSTTGRVTAVASDGSVWQLGPAGWEQVGDPDPEVAEWTLRCCCWDPPRSRLVVWGFHGENPNSRLGERTAVWAEGSWTRLEAGSTMPPGGEFLRANLDHQMVFDTALQAVVFAGAHSISLLDSDRWHPSKPTLNIYRGASSGSTLLVHDQESGVTLFIDTSGRWCGHLSGGELERTCKINVAPDKLSTCCKSTQARRSAMVYVPDSRSVLVFASGASYDQYWELPLADVFTSSARSGEPRAFARSDPSEKRFTATLPRAITARDETTGEPDARGDDLFRFRRLGNEPPADWSAPTHTTDEQLLAFDPVRRRPILVRDSGGCTECWHKVGDVWELMHRSEGLPYMTMTTTAISGDPQRGVVFWCVDERHGTCAYQVTDQALVPLATSGDGPVRGDDHDHRDKMAIVWDSHEGRILAFSTEGLWALDTDDRWTRLAAWNGATPLHQVGSFRDGDGGAWDALGHRLVMWRSDYSDGLTCWSVSEAGVEVIDEAHLGDSRSCFIAGSDRGLLLYDGSGQTLLRLESSGWVELAAGEQAPRLDRVNHAVMACQGDDDDELAIEITGWRPFRFYSRRQSTWRADGQPDDVERPRGATLLGRHDGQLLAADTMSAWLHDGERWRELPELMQAFFETDWSRELGHRTSILCVSTSHESHGGDRPGRVVCESGAVAELGDDGWTLHRPQGDLPGRDGYYQRGAAFCPDDSSWLVMVGDDEHALTFRGTYDGHWEEVCQLPYSDGLRTYDNHELVFDARLGCFVLAGKGGVFHLRDGAWKRVDIDDLPECERLIHDHQTGATLLFHVYEGEVFRLGASDFTELGRMGPPAATRQRAVRSLPGATDLLADSPARRLVWFDYQDAWGDYELDLADLFEKARVLGTLES